MSALAPVRYVLLAGPSGSGKGVLTSRLGVPVVELDDFYRDLDEPGLPRRFGIVDWDDPASWNAEAALDALEYLAEHRACDLPQYSIPKSRRTGSKHLDLGSASIVVAEGIFAAELIPELSRRGLLADAVVLSRPRALNFILRLQRDLVQGRKPPLTLLRRGSALFKEEKPKMQAWRNAGMRPLNMRGAVKHVRLLHDLQGSAHRVKSRRNGNVSSAARVPTATTSPGVSTPAANTTPGFLNLAAVCFLRFTETGAEVLQVRKQGTAAFMLPGGKLEPGEDSRQCARREIAEELGLNLAEDDLHFLGDFEADAANEANTRLTCGVYLAPLSADLSALNAQAEIAEARWFPLAEDQLQELGEVSIAPLSLEQVFPVLRSLLAA